MAVRTVISLGVHLCHHLNCFPCTSRKGTPSAIRILLFGVLHLLHLPHLLHLLHLRMVLNMSPKICKSFRKKFETLEKLWLEPDSAFTLNVVSSELSGNKQVQKLALLTVCSSTIC